MNISITVHSRTLGDVSVDRDTDLEFRDEDAAARQLTVLLKEAVQKVERAYGIEASGQ